MCGRYSLNTTAQAIMDRFACQIQIKMRPRYNIAPSQPIPVILSHNTHHHHQQQQQQQQPFMTFMRWGLVPPWSDDLNMGNRLINARSETVTEKQAFRYAFKRRRCLIPATGFYEWPQRKKRGQLPTYFWLKKSPLFAFAGLWETWQDAAGNELDTCCILTCPANALIKPIHERMPVIIDGTDQQAQHTWLNTHETQAHELLDQLTSYSAEYMESQIVSSYVNTATHEGPSCLEPGQLF